MRARLATIAYLAATLAAPAAEVDPRADPAVWLRQIYDLYHRAEKDEALAAKSSDELVAPRASRSFAALLKREDDCVRKTREICAIDWDYIVDGQDWKLSDVKVGRLMAAGDKATVTVAFKNMNAAKTNVYFFVREGGEWRLDDIEARETGLKTIRIAKWLRDYKDY